MYLKEAGRNFHVRLSGIVETLLQKVPPMFLLPAAEVILPSSPPQTTLVSSETTLEVRSDFGVKKTVVFDEVIMKTLEYLVAENSDVKERLKRQDEKTLKIEGMFGLILSILPPIP